MKLSEELRDSIQTLRRTPMPLATMIPLLQKAADELDRMEKELAPQPITRGTFDSHERYLDAIPCEVIGVAGDQLLIQHMTGYATVVVKKEIPAKDFTPSGPLEFWAVKLPNGTYSDKGGGSSAPALYNTPGRAKAKCYKHGRVVKWVMKEVEA